MSVRVVARIRPLLKSELEIDSIVEVTSPNIVRIPNPKNVSESFSFQFNTVYNQQGSQQDLFDNEISPTVKHLFNGFDVTVFAFGISGTGKTHTMRGGKTLAERGVIPRLLSSIYRRGRKIEKDTNGQTRMEVSMSYYEIYNDHVFDLFEPSEKRTLAGLPIRDNNGKTVVVGLSERPCTSLKDFELLYDQANVNRSTSATKLNAHSSRSHAILRVKICQITDEYTIVSTASAIDLAGSEDNRRTENGKERLVESSSINKSLFVLAQCVEAISKKQARIPYRESKMTRILSLGQNNGLTIMILNLAPVRSYHLDTLSSLNFANRTKKIEIREVENEPIFKGPSKLTTSSMSTTGSLVQRQPLRPIPVSANIGLSVVGIKEKPLKSFSVFAEKSRAYKSSASPKTEDRKRSSDGSHSLSPRPTKLLRPNVSSSLGRGQEPELSRAIEELVNRMVDEKLATRALNNAEKPAVPPLSEDVKRRLEALENRVERKEDNRAEGLQYLLMAKQHQFRNEDSSALKMYQLALPYFPNNEKLVHRLLRLQEKIRVKNETKALAGANSPYSKTPVALVKETRFTDASKQNDSSQAARKHSANSAAEEDYESDNSFRYKPKARKPTIAGRAKVFTDISTTSQSHSHTAQPLTPRTSHLLRIINTRDQAQIRSLKGIGAKKAETIASSLCLLDEHEDGALITDLEQLGGLKGVGARTVENMRAGISI